MRRTCILLLVAALAGAAETPSGELPPRLLELHEEVLAELHELRELAERPRLDPGEPLGRTLTLGFRLLPAGEVDAPLSVSVATTTFEVAAEITSVRSRFGLEVVGEVDLVGPEQENLAVAFHAALAFEGDDQRMRVTAEGSATIPVGEAAVVAHLGERSLEITVSEGAPDRP